MFFFASQEFTDDARPAVTTTANYPTALERMGDFSQTFQTTSNAYGQLLPIIDYKTGQPFPGNIIPLDRINPVGQKLLNFFLNPNGYVPPGGPSTRYDANFIANETPLHSRVDYTFRGDVVMTKNLRFSGKVLANKEDNIIINAFGPGFGRANNFVPGWLVGGTVTYVMSPTMVNVLNGGYTLNHYAFRGYPDGFDYTQYYAERGAAVLGGHGDDAEQRDGRPVLDDGRGDPAAAARPHTPHGLLMPAIVFRAGDEIAQGTAVASPCTCERGAITNSIR